MRRHCFAIAFATFLLATSPFATRAQFEGEHINTGTNHPAASIQDTETAAQRKGGNYLLNIGPDSKGNVPPVEIERLHEVGGWLAVNGVTNSPK